MWFWVVVLLILFWPTTCACCQKKPKQLSHSDLIGIVSKALRDYDADPSLAKTPALLVAERIMNDGYVVPDRTDP